jgi:hypothetical protein
MSTSSAVAELLSQTLTDEQMKALRHRYYALRYRGDLTKLAVAFGTDKEGAHHYSAHYRHHFAPWRTRPLNVLEIGIGGYDAPAEGGNSLRMWKAYFPKARIYGIDIYDKSPHDEHRIKTYRGSQVDADFLRRVVAEIGTVDIVIDDGSHFNEHIVETFGILFPLLAPQGIYAIEDLQTSYWEGLGGISWGATVPLDAPHTSMNFLKRLVDGLNFEEYAPDGAAPSYSDRHIVSMHFYHSLAFIYKGNNLEGSSRFGKRFG